MQSTQSLLAYLDVVFELWFQTVIQHGWDPERVAVWSDSGGSVPNHHANGESEKSKCQIETLIGLTSPIGGQARFQRHAPQTQPETKLGNSRTA